MTLPLPDLSLSQGQMNWALCQGQEPDKRVRDQLRYLRQLGIPKAAGSQAKGSGRRITYDFYDLVETGLGLTGLTLGSRPKDLSEILVDNRADLRKLYAMAWTEMPEASIDASWVKSRGRQNPILGDEIYLSLHDRWRDRSATYDFVTAEEASDDLPFFETVQRFPNEPPRRVVSLKRVMLPWVAWALEAPPTKPGPKS